MRNRYYDTARLYAPSNSRSLQPKELSDIASRNAQPTHALVSDQSTKMSEKNVKQESSDGAMHEPNQEQVYIVDDSSNNITEDDEDSQMKYLYSLYKNRLANNF